MYKNAEHKRICHEKDDAAMMTNPQYWPSNDHLFVKIRAASGTLTDMRVGIMRRSETGKGFTIHENMVDPPVVHKYDSVDLVLADGWVVD